MNWEAMLKPALIAGVLVGVLSALPLVSALNCFCCAWVIGGGVWAAYLLIQASPITVTLGRGAALGLATGAIAATVDTLFSIPLHFALAGVGSGIAEQMNEVLRQVPDVPPDVREALRSVFSDNRGVGVLFLVLTGFFKLIIYSAVCMLGGAVGVAIFEKRPPGTDLPPSPPAYRPPQDFPPPPESPGA
jgi:hypothetical protein